MITQLPAFSIDVAGQELGDEVLPALAQVRVRQRACSASQCVLHFQFQTSDDHWSPKIGDKLDLLVGDPATSLFRGRVSAVEFSVTADEGNVMFVRAYDGLAQLGARRSAVRFDDISVVELAKTLVEGSGLRVVAHAEGPSMRGLIQAGESDLDFLTNQLSKAGLFCIVIGDELHLFSLTGTGEATSIDARHDCFEVSVEDNSLAWSEAVQVQGWDSGGAKDYQADVHEAQSLCDSKVPPGADARLLLNLRAQSTGHAAALAQARYDRDAARATVLRASLAGNPKLAPGMEIQIEGLHSRANGRFCLFVVEHKIDPIKGYVVEVDSQPPEESVSVTKTQLTLGTVSAIDDPESWGRVRVVLDAIGAVKTDWLPVCLPGAGSDHGLVSLPDVGDRVFVLFGDLCTEQGLVLGGFSGPKGPKDTGVRGAKAERHQFRTTEGHKVLLDETKDRILVEHPGGSSIELSKKGVRVSSKGSLVLEAPGDKVVIRGSRIDLERG